MSRTYRDVPEKLKRKRSPHPDRENYRDWCMTRFERGLGRDGGYSSSVCGPDSDAPKCRNSWDDCWGGGRKWAKTQTARLVRRQRIAIDDE